MQSETVAQPSRCTARSHRTWLPTGLGRSAFVRVYGPTSSSSPVTSVLPNKGGERLAKKPLHAVARRSRRRIPQAPPHARSRSSRLDFSSLSRSHVTSRADGGDRDSRRTEKASAPTAALKSFLGHFPGYLCAGTRVPV
jgi:hypothetical protein